MEYENLELQETELDKFINLIRGGNTCKDCGYAMQFDHSESIVCGVHLINFSPNSICDQFLTPQQVKEKNKARYIDILKSRKLKK